MWSKPQSGWLIWLWHVVSWSLTIILMGMSAVIAYLISQVLFAVVIMDQMSRLTEKIVTGSVAQETQLGWWQQFGHLIRQEIPRAVLPVGLTLLLTIVSWLTPLGPLATVLLSAAAVVFIAWDSTDLTPARRLQSFGPRFRFLMRTLPFHLGFGALFLIPVANILFLAFAPIGATLYFLDTQTDSPADSGSR
jgi:CysZ protein